MPKPLRWGKDAVALILMKFIHPSTLVGARFPNAQSTTRLDDCRLVRLQEKIINRKPQIAVVFRHVEFREEMYVAQRYATVTAEGPEHLLFERPNERPSNDNHEAVKEGNGDGQEDVEIPAVVLQPNFQVDDPNLLHAVLTGIIEINDDNKPVPENIPLSEGQRDNTRCWYNKEWGHDGLCSHQETTILAKTCTW